MVEPFPLAEAPSRVPHLMPELWVGGIDAREWWLCLTCHRCTLEPGLMVWPDDGSVACPHCESDDLYRWSGWPSRVVLAWSDSPEPGRVYTLPDSLWSIPGGTARGQ